MATTSFDQVSDDQLRRYSDLIYDKTGIKISSQKKTLLSNRLRRRLRATGIECFDEYYRLLTSSSTRSAEWAAFLQEVTTHETYLFRDPAQWEWFRGVYLPALTAERKDGRRSLRIWSAACSSGEEPCTIACCIADAIRDAEKWSIDVLGTDIGEGALKQAALGQYGDRSMRLVPAGIRDSRFEVVRGTTDRRLKAPARNWVRFRRHNLIEPLGEPAFDVAFVKNVLIYFDADSKRRVMEHVRRSLRPGGLLVTGPAEGVGDMLQGMQRIENWLHRKTAN